MHCRLCQVYNNVEVYEPLGINVWQGDIVSAVLGV